MTDKELIHAVATKVMGWNLLDRVASGWGKGPDVYGTGDEDSPALQAFDPIGDIGHAFKIVDEVSTRDYEYRLLFQVFVTAGDKWYAEISSRDICEAALKAAERREYDKASKGGSQDG